MEDVETGTINSHVKSNPTSPHHKCKVCRFETDTEESMKMHQKSFHSMNKTIHYCKVCPFVTLHETSLKAHMENLHSNTKDENVVTVAEDSRRNLFKTKLKLKLGIKG